MARLSGGHRRAEPVFEMRLSESRVTAGNERGLAHLNAVVARLRVGNYLARILACGETSPNQLIQTKLFRARLFQRCHSGVSPCDAAQGTGDIIGRHGLDEGSWQAYCITVGGNIGDAFDEFEELRRAND